MGIVIDKNGTFAFVPMPYKDNTEKKIIKDGGRVVCITSTHWKNSSNKKETEFRKWLDKKSAITEDVDAGEFKESGTMVSTVIIMIIK